MYWGTHLTCKVLLKIFKSFTPEDQARTWPKNSLWWQRTTCTAYLAESRCHRYSWRRSRDGKRLCLVPTGWEVYSELGKHTMSLPVGEDGTALALLQGSAERECSEAGRPPAQARVAVGAATWVLCHAGGQALALATSGLAGAGGPGRAGVHLASLRRERGKLPSATWRGDTCQALSWRPEPPVSSQSWPEKVYGPFFLPKKRKTRNIASARDEFAPPPC